MSVSPRDLKKGSLGTVITWLPYQLAWLRDKSRFKIGKMTRQGGKSFCSAGEIVEDCIDHEIDGRKTHWVVLSRGERQAVEYMQKNCIPMVKSYYALFAAALKNAKPPPLKEVEYTFDREMPDGTILPVKYKAHEITLPNGSRITALPANPDTARGFSANVLLDEFAFHADSRAIWTALFPCITRGYKIRVISTPNGKNNKFYELMTETDGVWSKHIVTIHDAIAMGLDVDAEELKAGLGDDDAWDQEYELKWADGVGAVIPWDDIVSCEMEGAGDPKGFTGQTVYIGNDIAGQGGDLWVAIVTEDVNDRLVIREILTERKATFKKQDDLMDALVERYKMNKLAMDETGMGAKPVEDAVGRYGSSRVIGVHFTQQNKQDMVNLLQKKFQDRRIGLPVGDKLLRADLHSVKKSKNPGGSASYKAPTGGESHGDRFWALALAIYAASGELIEYAYHSASKNADPKGAAARRRVRTSSGLKNMKGAY